ncbi:MAG: glycine-rich protein [Bacteroidota bacterium]
MNFQLSADSGMYFFEANGAQGGAASNASHQGGKGARMQGYVNLFPGDVEGQGSGLLSGF